ncbi:hypothetical protein BGX27_008937 [Mortierella sp. AM989]|nr:hypothetical protein BGX27_008937 [Mortierella sp. AM989]
MASNVTFTDKELKELTEKFTEFDTNKDGRIDVNELDKLVKSLGQSATKEELDFVLKAHDTNSDNGLDLNEFLSLMSSLRKA